VKTQRLTHKLRGFFRDAVGGLTTARSVTLASLVLALVAAPLGAAHAAPRLLKFSGVPTSQAYALRNRFPFVFEREVKLSEVDDIIRYLMSTGNFSNIEVVERGSGDNRELILVASLLRKIQDVHITGSSVFSSSEISEILGVGKGKPFERKNLLEAAKNLQGAYADRGFYNSRVEIDFDLPNENEVVINVKVTEGPPTKITEVLIDTPSPELTERLKRFSKKLLGHNLGGSELIDFQKSVAEYLQSNRYITARLSDPSTTFNSDRTQVRLGYTVENPWKFEFIFEGNQYFSDGSIIRQLELDKLSGAVSSPAPDLTEKIRRIYQTAGFANVEIEFTEKLFENSHLEAIRFSIKEGPRVRIKKVEVAGNISRPEEYYANFIRSSSSDLIGAGFYNRRDIEDGTKRLVTELQNQGFMRARVQSSRIEYSKDKASVVVHLTIDEGPLTQIRQIRFSGVEAFPKTQLTSLLSIKSGAALSLRELEDSIQKLKDFYRNQGYLEMRITNENEKDRIVTYNDSNTQAVVDFQIYEGPRISVGSLVLQGNALTKDYVITRELDFKKGDVLTPKAVDDSVFKLQKLGLFSRVGIRTLEEGSMAEDRTVLIDVVERDPGLFTMGIGAATERAGFLRLRGYAGLAYRNIFGTGRALSFRVDPSYSTDPAISYIENRITVSYLEPYIFGDSNRGRVNLIRDQYFFEFDTDKRAVIQETNTVNFLLERDLSRNIKLTHTAYSFSNQRKFYRDDFNVTENLNIAKMGPMLEFDYRDDPFNPSRGTYSTVGLEYADPLFGSSQDAFQSIQFAKVYGSTTYYQPIQSRRDFVWATSVRGGYLSNMSTKAVTKPGVPSQEAFRLGGRTTIRGFDSSEAEQIPNIYDLGVAKMADFRIGVDSYYYLIKTELRFPLWKGSPVGGAIFYDGGAVLISGVNLPVPYRDSVGLGLRIGTPVGPVNVEVGFKLHPRVIREETPTQTRIAESPYAFHVSIGTF
jgi:outer membrane protein assembly complex protein YaeT